MSTDRLRALEAITLLRERFLPQDRFGSPLPQPIAKGTVKGWKIQYRVLPTFLVAVEVVNDGENLTLLSIKETYWVDFTTYRTFAGEVVGGILVIPRNKKTLT